MVAFFTAVFSGCADIYADNYVKISMPYGKEERQVLDLYLPKSAGESTGLILLIHGGGWIAGDKESYRNDLKTWSEKGYAAAAMNYRYASDSTGINDILDDITSALGCIKDYGAKKGISIDKVLFHGASAGGHLSLLYAYSRNDEAPITPAAVVDFCGPVDLTNPALIYGTDNAGNALGDEYVMCELLSKCCGSRFTPEQADSVKDLLYDISPAKYVNESSVPTVICHGAKDSVVPYSDAITLDSLLTAAGVRHDFLTYENSNHGLESDPDKAEAAFKLFEEYAAEYLK